MTKTETLKTLILRAAEAGKLTLADIEDGEDFESIQEYVDYASDLDIEEVAILAGLVDDTRPDIHELNREQSRRLAGHAGIKGA